ncbi:hypothetical protein EWI07_08470 [Sporolactobacillus sp. THM7-4]|nr:hypothetical protein EWI07_08470 [Sporolactobacillus sp. THM7-4]
MYKKKELDAAALLYEVVAKCEKYQYSERLAICQYRLFKLAIGKDSATNLQAAIRFEPFQDKLPENFRLDALLQLANVYYTLQNWHKMGFFADELRTLATVIYRGRYQNKKGKRKPGKLNIDRPLVVYYGQGYLIKGGALEYQEQYEEAKKYIDGYADLSWFEGLDEIGRLEVEKFKVFARMNCYNIDLSTGNFEVLNDYVHLLEKYPDEILPSMVVILMAANKYRIKIDTVLKKLASKISVGVHSENYYSRATYRNRYAEFHYQLAIYNFANRRIKEGIENTLQCLKLSVEEDNKGKMLDCISLFEKFKGQATKEQETIYETIVKGVNKDAETLVLSGYSYQPELLCSRFSD